MNSHFKQPCGPSPSNGSKKTSATSSPIKFYIRKNRRKSRVNNQTPSNCGSERTDPFHIGIMAGIKDGLSKFKKTQKSDESILSFDPTGSQLLFHNEVKSRRLDENGNIHFLVSWQPSGM